MTEIVFGGVSPRSLGDLLKGYGIMAILGEEWPHTLFWWDDAFHLVVGRPCDNGDESAIYLTPGAPRYSVRARGRFSLGSGRIRAALRDRSGVPRVPVAAPLAGRLPGSAVRADQSLAGARARADAMRRVWASDLCHCRHYLSGQSDAAPGVVPSHVGGHQSENGRQRPGPPA